MTPRRVLIDIEFAVDEDSFKVAQLTGDPSGVSDVTDAGVRQAVTRLLLHPDWAAEGLTPLRSIVTSRPLNPDGSYGDEHLPADRGVADD